MKRFKIPVLSVLLLVLRGISRNHPTMSTTRVTVPRSKGLVESHRKLPPIAEMGATRGQYSLITWHLKALNVSMEYIFLTA